MEWIKTIYVFLAMVPFVVFAIAFGTYVLFSPNKNKAAGCAMDVTVVFLIGSVSVMYDQLIPGSIRGWAILLLMFVIMIAVIGNLQNRIRGKVDVLKLLRVVWRIGFFVLSVGYVVLCLIGIIQYMA